MNAFVLLPDGSTRMFVVTGPPPSRFEFHLCKPVSLFGGGEQDALDMSQPIVAWLDSIKVDAAGFPSAHYNAERIS